MQTNILEYLPPIIANIKEMIAHAEAEKPELERLWDKVNASYDNQFLYSMREDGIQRWETILGIYPLPSDTLEDRRFRVINRLNAQLPYSYKMLESHLIQMCGKDNFSMSYDKNSWTLKIRVALSAKKQYDEIFQLVNQMIPANLLLDYDLLYNKHSMLEKYTHAQLKAFTHEQLRDEILN